LERNAQEDEVRTEMRRLAVKAVRALRPIEAWLLGSLYGLWGREPQTLGEIAAKSGRSPEKLRNLKSSALTKLRERIGDQAEAYLNTLED
jgi:DNA-directed RNA polymerase sigma subunit (sigma70/sigma32)